jgi:hypothetical protein
MSVGNHTYPHQTLEQLLVYLRMPLEEDLILNFGLAQEPSPSASLATFCRSFTYAYLTYVTIYSDFFP